MGKKDIHIAVKILEKADIGWLSAAMGQKVIGLSGNTTEDEVGLLISSFVGMNGQYLDKHADKEELIGQMIQGMEQEKLELPGGLHFEGDGEHIYPGVGCDLNSWPWIADALMHYKSPWMGMEPKVTFRLENGICFIADKDLREWEREELIDGLCYRTVRRLKIQSAIQDKGTAVISYRQEEFQAALAHLQQDFVNFVEGPLKSRMEELHREMAGAFCRQFRRRYG